MTAVQVQTQVPDRDELMRLVPHQSFRLVKFFENIAKDVSTTIPDAIGQSIQGPSGGVGDRDVVIFDGATGYSVKDSGITIDSLAPLNSPHFTGVPTAPTPAPLDSSTKIATTAFVGSATTNAVQGPGSSVNSDIALFNGATGKLIKDSGVQMAAVALLASPAFTGTPTAPTATVGTNTTQLATTAFVQAATGRLLGTQTFTATGVYTPTAGTTRIVVKGQGAGGAGGGATATAAGQVSMGSGGGAGGIGETFLTSGFSGVTVTVGSGGAGNSGAAGSAGGASSFGASMTLNGGAGGSVAAAGTATSAASVAGGTSSGGTILAQPGQGASALSCSFAAGFVTGGIGGSSLYGSGGSGNTVGTGGATGGTGLASLGRAAGGGGAVSAAGGGAQTGGAGTGAIFIVYEYS